MKKILLVLLLLISQIYSQDKISFEFDYAKFNYDSTKTYLELYYSLGQSTLSQFKEDNKTFIGAYLDVSIEDAISKKVLVNNRYVSKTGIKDSDSTYKSQNILGNLGFILNSGKYLFNISATDIVDSNKTLTFNEIIEIPEILNDRYSLSDIELATRIISDRKNVKSIF